MRLLIIIFISLTFVGCMEEPIPNEVNLNLIKEGFVFPHIIKVYEFKSDGINDSDIFKKNISCFGNKNELFWTQINHLKSNVKNHLLIEINHSSKSSETFEELINLNEKLDKSNYIFFTGCYSLPKNHKGEPTPFYNYMYFLDTENRKFYSFEWVR